MEEPRIERVVPVLGISSYEEAVEHYVDWLGFKLDLEWREAPGQPVIMAISRDSASFMLNESPSSPNCADVTLHVVNLEGLSDEWNKERPGSTEVQIEFPYELPTLSITDSFGNTLRFHGESSEEQERLRARNVPRMRDYVRRRLDDGLGLPTPAEVRGAVGPVLGFAIEVLNEFPEYADAHRAQQMTPK